VSTKELLERTVGLTERHVQKLFGEVNIDCLRRGIEKRHVGSGMYWSELMLIGKNYCN
jgi:hypothetical protein